MSLITTDDANYKNIADAVRYKLESSETYEPDQLADAIMLINTTPGVMAIRGSAETEFRTGEVVMSAANVGALATDGTAVRATSDADGNNIASTYEKKANVISKGSDTVPVYFDANGVATPIVSYSGNADTATSATQDSAGNNIANTYEPKANVTSVGSVTKPVYFDENGVAKPITSYEGNAATATNATNDAEGSPIASTYEPKASVSSKGTATKPVYFDVDGIAKPITSYEGNAATATKAEQDINGDAINTTYVKKSTIASKGSATLPIYFDINGSPLTITSYEGNAATATNATNDEDGNSIKDTYERKDQLAGKGNDTTPVYMDANGNAQTILSYGGNAATASKLKTAINVILGEATKTFDGSSNLHFTLTEMGITIPSVSSDGVLIL